MPGTNLKKIVPGFVATALALGTSFGQAVIPLFILAGTPLLSNAATLIHHPTEGYVTAIEDLDVNGTLYDATFHLGKTFNELWPSVSGGGLFDRDPLFWGMGNSELAEVAGNAIMTALGNSERTSAVGDRFLVPWEFHTPAGVISSVGDGRPEVAVDELLTAVWVRDFLVPTSLPYVSFEASAIPLSNGIPATGLSAPLGGELRFTLEVPAGVTGLRFQISGGKGDADLYVQFGSAPTLGSYNCRPYLDGNNEACSILSATAGTWHVLVHGYSAFKGVSLVASYISGPVLSNGIPASVFSTALGGERRFTLEVPAGATNLEFQISGGIGDADLYVQFGNEPTLYNFDCRPYLEGNNETCTMPSATEGTWHVLVHGYAKFKGVSVVGSYTEGGVLNDGIAALKLNAAAGDELRFTLEVPAGATGLSFQINSGSGGSGDADLYVQFGSAPTLNSFDCRPFLAGNNETCIMPSATAGTWYVLVHGYSAFVNLALVGNYTAGSVLNNGVPVIDLDSPARGELRFTLEVPAGATDLSFGISGGKGDADLYVQFGSEPTLYSYGCRPYAEGNIETCAMPDATAGTWHVLVHGYSSFIDVILEGGFTGGPP